MMKKLILVLMFISLTRLFSLYQSVDYGEIVKFNGRLFVISGGINRGLTAFEIIY